MAPKNYPNPLPPLVSCVKELRQKANILRMVELSRKAGIWPSRLSKIENGKTIPTAQELAQIAWALGTSMESLVGIEIPRRNGQE